MCFGFVCFVFSAATEFVLFFVFLLFEEERKKNACRVFDFSM